MSHMSRINLEISETVNHAQYEFDEGDMGVAFKALTAIREKYKALLDGSEWAAEIDAKIEEIAHAIRETEM